MDLVIQHLWKTYPNGTTALRDVSLTIPPGLFGLLGPNGAGKSTLMRILATLQEAEGGNARLGEIDVLRDHAAVRRTLGYLPQEFGVYPRVAAEDMLDHFALLKGLVNRRERRDTVHSLLQKTNLWEARKQKLGGFSGGMRQRFGIAVALIGEPRLIIVDEPTAGLDPAERARFLNLLSELGESAVVILSTHIVEDVSELCTRMAIIAAGRILLEAEPARVVQGMRGRVWRRQVDRADLPRYEQAMPVISTTLVGGRTVIHVYADAPPDPTFEPVEPDLKDVYFTAIRGLPISGPGVSAPSMPPSHPASMDAAGAVAAPVIPQPSAVPTASSVDAPPSIAIDPSSSVDARQPMAADPSTSTVDEPPSVDPPSSGDARPSVMPDPSSTGDARTLMTVDPSPDVPPFNQPTSAADVVAPADAQPSARDDRARDAEPFAARPDDYEVTPPAAGYRSPEPWPQTTAGPGAANMPVFGRPDAEEPARKEDGGERKDEA